MSLDSTKRGSEPSEQLRSLDRVFRLYWISIVGVILYVALDTVVQSLPPHYSPIRDAESDLAVGPYGYIMTVNFVNRGILSLSFVYAFIRTLDLTAALKSPFRTGYYMITGWAIGAILLAIFPTDVPPTPISWHGAIHLLVAIIAFICGAFGTFLLSRHFNEAVATKGAKNLAQALGSLSVLLLFVELFVQFLVPHFAARIFGLTERLFLGSVLVWILALSIYLIIHKRSIMVESSHTMTLK